jgi:peptidoglycan/LPS O-acetylase OafA/YrhL
VVGWTLPRWIDFSVMPWAYAVIAFACAIAAASACYLLFEKPVTRWLQDRIAPTVPADLSPTAGAATPRPLG